MPTKKRTKRQPVKITRRAAKPYIKGRQPMASVHPAEMPVTVPDAPQFTQNCHLYTDARVYRDARVMQAGGGPEINGPSRMAYKHTDRQPDAGANPEIVL